VTFAVGDKIVRKQGEDTHTWVNECNNLKLNPFAVFTVSELLPALSCLRVKELPVNVAWVQDRFTYATPPDKSLEEYL
jgi:hypothetical protein